MLEDQYMIPQRSVDLIARRMIARMAADCLCFLAQNGVAEVLPGKAWRMTAGSPRGEWADYDAPLEVEAENAFPPDVFPVYVGSVKAGCADAIEWGGGRATEMSPELVSSEDTEAGRSQPVTIGEALETVGNTAAAWTVRLRAKLNDTGIYRAAMLSRAARREIIPRNYARAVSEVAQNILPKERRKLSGPQYLSTRKTKWIGKEDGYHNGKPAKHYPVGKPPLSEAEWLRRYRARRKKERKTKRRYTMKTRKPLTTAPTISRPRPERATALHPTDRPPAPPEWLRKWTVKHSLDKLGFIDRGAQWEALEKSVWDKTVAPALAEEANRAFARCREWLQALADDMAANLTLRLLPASAKEVLGAPSKAMGAQWPD